MNNTSPKFKTSPSEIDISIIIPNLHSPVIAQTLESLVNQNTPYSFEIIVVGQDKYNLIDAIKTHLIKHIKTEKPTPPGIARNIGVSNANGNFLFFLDADCITKNDWLNSHMDIHKNSLKPLLVGGGVAFSAKNFVALADNISTFHEYMEHISAGVKEQLPSLNMSLPRSIWEKIGGFNSSFPFAAGEDAEFTTRALVNNVTLWFDPDAKIYHHHNRNKIHDLITHAYRFGYFSIKADERYQRFLKTPTILKNSLYTFLFSPLLALYVIAKMLIKENLPFRYWHTIPLVYFLKIIWCVGLSNRIKFNNRNRIAV